MTITLAASLAAAPPPPNALALPATGAAIDLPTAPAPRPAKLSSEQARQLAAMLRGAPVNGIALPGPPAETASDVPVAGDADLIDAALTYARAVHAGQLDEGDFQRDWGLRPASYDPASALYNALRQDRLAGWIAALPPPYAGYEGLRRGLARYRDIQAAGGWQPLSPGEDLVLGAKGRRVAELRARLRAEDAAVASGSDTFDLDLLDAVRRVQRRYGLDPTGNVAAQTRAALDVPVSERIAQMVANMERWRWLPQDLSPDRIQVNIAAAILTVFHGDSPVMSMRVVTGRPGDETPMLQSRIHSIVLNPPWNVPTSITTKELLPKEQAHPGYLKRNGFTRIRQADGGTRLQQAAGTRSALGRFKFDFDNPYSVYLHDTPSQGTFARYSRLASHGCVRLEKPAALAELLLKDDPRWSDDAIEAVVAKTDTVRIRLPSPIAVYLLYWTAFASADGAMNFRPDPYGWDTMLAAKIGARGAAPQLTSR